MIYRPPLHGISASEAWAEAAAHASADVAVIETLSIAHPAIGADTELYIVNAYTPLLAGLEQDATINGGQTVTFTPSAFALTPPVEAADDAQPTLKLSIVGVSEAVAQALRATRGSLNPVVITLREYVSNELGAPARVPPLRMELVDVDINDSLVEITAQARDPGNVAYPAKTITLADYPGLSG